MNLKALHCEARADALGHVGIAIEEIRKTISVEPSCGPLLIECYRCLSALAQLRELIDCMAEVDREPRT